MPLILGRAAGDIVSLAAAEPGCRVEVAAPDGVDTSGVPAPSWIIGWVLVADETAAGGSRIDPVFLADGRAWTPDQYRATYGQQLTVQVGRAA